MRDENLLAAFAVVGLLVIGVFFIGRIMTCHTEIMSFESIDTQLGMQNRRWEVGQIKPTWSCDKGVEVEDLSAIGSIWFIGKSGSGKCSFQTYKETCKIIKAEDFMNSSQVQGLISLIG